MTIAVSTVISAFNSLTLSPALAAILLKPHGAKRDPLTWLLDVALGWFFRLFNATFAVGTTLYVGVVGWLLRVSLLVLLVYGGLLGLTYWRVHARADRLHPEQDKGYLLLNVQLPDSASVERTRRVMATHRGASPARRRASTHTVGISGQSLLLNANAPNLGSMYVMLKEFAKRARVALGRRRSPRRCATDAGPKSATPWSRSSAPRRSTAWAPPAASR